MDLPKSYTAHVEGQAQDIPAPRTLTLLDALELAGIDWPSSCRDGSCGTCMGRLTSGRVRYEHEFIVLSDQDVADGYVLPCVAYPESDVDLEGSSF
ncbi:2Fe-2S iron-sulfur cluster-binding protein [Comamonas flocculans]|uniref:2Fe-2S iron-sulfur cluster binding domain-containing protein n=1 Tax=Comamonas flocculans TaxID=2597701 RepID=A0A5B8RRH1_9BURK|nr:2Fe-2S iron-sulfur cluster binding domain-containing protein [Comamonas flocculans]QEA11613.1 2Fe-2S iron-sulfur cluster binding domain-containing protein [Comamonas flocculans]